MNRPVPEFAQRASLSPAEAEVHTLANGVRVLVLPTPGLPTAQVSVFVRSGSLHEPKRLGGISHVVEHMAFKGTATRSCQQINLDAERLGAEVNAHTDKDHTAFHMAGLARDAAAFVGMLGDILRHGTFPASELERERQVILQEFTEDEDDAMSTAFKLFDKLCFGDHPAARPVIGSRKHIERFTRDDLIGYVQQQYTGANVVVGVIGGVQAEDIVRAAEAALGDMPTGTLHSVAPPVHLGGVAARRLPGYAQAHVVMGYPIASLTEDHHAALLAAAVFGEGMSSPLMDRIREQLGLVYYAACSADVSATSGQLVIEASTSPEHLDAYFAEVTRLLGEQAQALDPVDLERARNQLTVRLMRAQERPAQRLEAAVQDLFAFGRVRPGAELMARLHAVPAAEVQGVFKSLAERRAAVALTGRIARGVDDRVRAAFGLA